MRVLWLLLLCSMAAACGPPPPCCGPPPPDECCVEPDINVTATMDGIVVECPNAVCAFVREELDPAPCGCTWQGSQHVPWFDGRIGPCIDIDQEDKDKLLRLTVRWWSQYCMGHVDVVLRLVIMPDVRDIFISYPSYEHCKVESVHVEYTASARAGSYDDVPQAEKSDMFFEVVMDEPETGVHMEITSCDIDILDGGTADAEVLTTYTNIDVNISYAEPNGEIAVYRAFMDDIAYSPFQRLICHYGMFNGTTTVDTFTHERSYMIVNPFDSGVIYS